jgi:hypothetical protein
LPPKLARHEQAVIFRIHLGADLRRLHPVRLLHGDVILQGGTYEDLRHEVRTEVLEEFREAIEIRLIGFVRERLQRRCELVRQILPFG